MQKIAVYTLGCKVNQLESEAISAAFIQAQWNVVSIHEAADLYLINSCTVTGKAEQKTRHIIYKVLRERPGTPIIVTGCYAQLESEKLSALDPHVFVVRGESKDSLLDLPRHLESGFPLETFRPQKNSQAFAFSPDCFSLHSRAFLKIQDGCNNHCSFCRVSIARGPQVSRPLNDILHWIKKFEESAFGEVVLTGINIGHYADTVDFAELLTRILRHSTTIRIRLSSFEPETINARLISVLSDHRIRPHFHLSIQSGSASILHAMRRTATPECIIEAVQKLRSCKNDPFIASDIIAGFPGETREDFQQTVQLCTSLHCAWIHAFPYSRRPGTEAFHLPNRVPDYEKNSRIQTLMHVAQTEKRAYIQRWIGKEVEAIVEHGGKALSENYLSLQLEPLVPAIKPGTSTICRITGYSQTCDAVATVLHV
ncbi:MAG: tRNA (N(6)-L-threonylcarbamoyladenosine(37)-C(2))-methylthiotransferase MtaB [Treponema sp.]|nr:tRNA (N(6)-L-threonylcarbamoyladenosine(37)-C(2))-methylthiotransferase MtaB [Treponema sp.]